MNSVMDAIKKRISIRAYQEKPLPEDVITSLLEAARYAPTARNAQQLEYKVITSQALSKKLSDRIMAALHKEIAAMPVPPTMPPPPPRPHIFYFAPLVIIIAGPKDNLWIDSDAALGVQNIMLYAASIGLGSCFIGMARLLEKDSEMLGELRIKDDQRIAACVVVGYPDEKPAPKEKKLKAEYFT
ncbi:MAG TPA: nitroreductase family protein [Dehalococcoidales bacterium]|nr:nitroreductase family protein [Dehalococcoidales bacterium]